MRLTHRTRPRRGAAAAETAVVLLVFLMLILGMIDLGIGVAANNALSYSARDAARQAMVHGQLAPAGWQGGPWGPGAMDQTWDGGAGGGTLRQPLAAEFPLTNVRTHVEWPDGSNQPGNRVRVTVSGEYHPAVAYLFGDPAISMRASSTMLIAH